MVISNHHNLIEEFQRNDVVLPEYHPKMGNTDFLDDKHMFYFFRYLKFIQSIEATISTDIRSRMESLPYETFIQRITRQVRYDSYNYGKNNDPEF